MDSKEKEEKQWDHPYTKIQLENAIAMIKDRDDPPPIPSDDAEIIRGDAESPGCDTCVSVNCTLHMNDYSCNCQCHFMNWAEYVSYLPLRPFE